MVFKLTYFVEFRIGYQPAKFQISPDTLCTQTKKYGRNVIIKKGLKDKGIILLFITSPTFEVISFKIRKQIYGAQQNF